MTLSMFDGGAKTRVEMSCDDCFKATFWRDDVNPCEVVEQARNDFRSLFNSAPDCC